MPEGRRSNLIPQAPHAFAVPSLARFVAQAAKVLVQLEAVPSCGGNTMQFARQDAFLLLVLAYDFFFLFNV